MNVDVDADNRVVGTVWFRVLVKCCGERDGERTYVKMSFQLSGIG